MQRWVLRSARRVLCAAGPAGGFCQPPGLTGQISPTRALLLAEKGAELEFSCSWKVRPQKAEPELILPAGWQAETRRANAPGSLLAHLRPPADQPAGHYQIRAAYNGVELMSGDTLSYPHIRSQQRFTPAVCEAALVQTASLSGGAGWLD